MPNVIDCLEERGFIDAITSEELHERAEKPMKVYMGFDPTADSLHLGNLVGIMALGWMQKFGHTPIVLLGGATGKIGDPSGKSIERPLLDEPTVLINMRRIQKHFERVLDFFNIHAKPLVLNNDEWLNKFSLIEFLRDVGKHFRVGPMLSKESVRARFDSEEGISFTEFSYQVLQGYDFYHLHSNYGVCLQMGGSDQWGNITAGLELIRKISGTSVYGLTWPLLTRSDGKKFGKSEEGAIWLAEDRCSVYDFYQYLVRVPDADVIKLMRMLTFMDMAEIKDYEARMNSKDYIPNTAQKRLAEEVTRMMHGEDGLETALRVTGGAAPGAKTVLNVDMLQEIEQDMPHVKLISEEVLGQKFVDVASKIGFLASKGEAVRLIKNGGAYLNNEKIEDPNLCFGAEHLIGGKYLLLGMGKKKKMLISLAHM
ncbi:MAG TPA: tyrosine--tRNA ligase [Rhabdochlamydiaceae bacterium]|nr:tyrosine--tRNA ligase [Rhabdochlamydiaceae bacterium]